MRHRKAFRKLNRTPAHRRALMRNLATELIYHDRIETTLPKAKELKRIADKLVTLGKKGTLHARRQAMGYLFAANRCSSGNSEKRTAVHRLFTILAPRYAERNGGYTRVVRTRRRSGDNAELAIIEFVEESFDKTPKRKRRVVRRTTEAAEAETPEPEATPSEEPQESAPEA